MRLKINYKRFATARLTRSAFHVLIFFIVDFNFILNTYYSVLEKLIHKVDGLPIPHQIKGVSELNEIFQDRYLKQLMSQAEDDLGKLVD